MKKDQNALHRTGVQAVVGTCLSHSCSGLRAGLLYKMHCSQERLRTALIGMFSHKLVFYEKNNKRCWETMEGNERQVEVNSQKQINSKGKMTHCKEHAV